LGADKSCLKATTKSCAAKGNTSSSNTTTYWRALQQVGKDVACLPCVEQHVEAMQAVNESKEVVHLSVPGDDLHGIRACNWVGDGLDRGHIDVRGCTHCRLDVLDVSQWDHNQEHLRRGGSREGDQRSKAEVVVGDIAEPLQQQVVRVQELALELGQELLLRRKLEVGPEAMLGGSLVVEHLVNTPGDLVADVRQVPAQIAQQIECARRDRAKQSRTALSLSDGGFTGPHR